MWLGEIPARRSCSPAPNSLNARWKTWAIAFPDIRPKAMSATTSSFDVRARVHPLERATAVRRAQVPHPARLQILRDPPVKPRFRKAREHQQEPPRDTLVGARHPWVSERPKHPLQQLAHRFPVQRMAFRRPAVHGQRAHLVHRLHPTRVDVHNHPPMIADPPPSPSCSVGISPFVHPHVTLDKTKARPIAQGGGNIGFGAARRRSQK